MEEKGLVGIGTYAGDDVVERTWFHKLESWRSEKVEAKTEGRRIEWNEDENGIVWGRYA